MTSALDYGVGYADVPRAGQIAELHAVDPDTGRSVCGQALAIAWSPEDSRGIVIDCPACLAALGGRSGES